MKKKPKYDLVLFIILMLLLFASLVQKSTGWVKTEPLKGVYPITPYPLLNLNDFRSGDYQKQMEQQLSERFGFREPVIRLYNQYLWDFYRKTYAHDIVAGKHNWLYYEQNVNDYYGTEMYRWLPDASTARETFDREARLMLKLRGILQDYGIEFLMFMAPEKGFLYPEHLPDRQHDTNSINAREYYTAKFEENGFPYIEMTSWFQALKEADTLPYSLISQTGAHWGFSSVLAADSLLRFMETLKGEHLPRLAIGPFHESADSTQNDDHDLEMNLNLLRKLRHPYDRLYDADVSVVTDSTVKKPKVLFIGNSYLWRMHYYIPFEELFEWSEFWFYNSTAYSGPGYADQTPVADLDIIEKILDADYVVWFTTGNQMYKATYGFVERALMNFCVDDDKVNKTRESIMDSLSLSWQEANKILINDPEHYFPELAGDSIPSARNPKVRETLVINEIKKDSVWMWNLSTCQTVIQNASLDQVLLMEAHNIIEGKPLMRDMTDVEAKRDHVESLVSDMIEEIQPQPELMERIRNMAADKGISVEKQTELTARWIVNDKIKRGLIVL